MIFAFVWNEGHQAGSFCKLKNRVEMRTPTTTTDLVSIKEHSMKRPREQR